MTADLLISMVLNESSPTTHRKVRSFDDVEHEQPTEIHAFHGTGNEEDIRRDGFKFGADVERHGFPNNKVFGRKHLLGDGIYFADSKTMSGKFGKRLKVQVKLDKPYVINNGRAEDLRKLNPEELKKQGYDGIICKSGKYGIFGGENYRQGVVFHPEKIKVVNDWDRIETLARGAKIRHRETGETGTVTYINNFNDQAKQWRRENRPEEPEFNSYLRVRWNSSKKRGTKARTEHNVKDTHVEMVPAKVKSNER